VIPMYRIWLYICINQHSFMTSRITVNDIIWFYFSSHQTTLAWFILFLSNDTPTCFPHIRRDRNCFWRDLLIPLSRYALSRSISIRVEFPKMTSRSVSPSVSSSMRIYRGCFVSDAPYDGSLKLHWSICIRSNQPARNRDSEIHIPELSHERVNPRHCRSVQPIQHRVIDLSTPRVAHIRMNVLQVKVCRCKKILLV